MSDTSLENSTAFVNERPASGECLKCGKAVEPYCRPAFMDLAARWFKPNAFCSSCEQARAGHEKILKAQKQLDEAFKSSGMSLRFKQRTFENFVPESNTQKAYEIALDYEPKHSGLLFVGSFGVGKTHLAAAIVNRQMGKIPTLFISCPEFLYELRERASGRKKDHQFYLFDLARTVALLTLDDIGAERSTEWVQETLFVLINYRYEQMLPTIFTTNCSLEELEEKIGKRITSRLVEMCRCVHVGGEDWRIKTRKQKVSIHHDESK